MGTAQRLGLEYDSRITFAELLTRFLADPASRQVDALVIGPWWQEGYHESSRVVADLAEASDRLSSLRAVFVGDVGGEECEISWIEQSDMTPLLVASPALEGSWASRYRTAVVSNGSGRVQRAKLASLGLSGTFGRVFLSGECGTAKPGPALFPRALCWAGCPASSTRATGRPGELGVTDPRSAENQVALAVGILQGLQAYCYAYPHKTAYRPLEPPIALDALWSTEGRESLFLYVHVPFCGLRCGFCNLFTRARPAESFVTEYLVALRRQTASVGEALGVRAFARLAVGGGTPNYLDVAGLRAVLDAAERLIGADLARMPVSVEVSPETVDAENLAFLVGRGASRISIGVETFVEAEAAAVYRPQLSATVDRALGLIRDSALVRELEPLSI